MSRESQVVKLLDKFIRELRYNTNVLPAGREYDDSFISAYTGLRKRTYKSGFVTLDMDIAYDLTKVPYILRFLENIDYRRNNALVTVMKLNPDGTINKTNMNLVLNTKNDIVGVVEDVLSELYKNVIETSVKNKTGVSSLNLVVSVLAYSKAFDKINYEEEPLATMQVACSRVNRNLTPYVFYNWIRSLTRYMGGIPEGALSSLWEMFILSPYKEFLPNVSVRVDGVDIGALTRLFTLFYVGLLSKLTLKEYEVTIKSLDSGTRKFEVDLNNGKLYEKEILPTVDFVFFLLLHGDIPMSYITKPMVK